MEVAYYDGIAMQSKVSGIKRLFASDIVTLVTSNVIVILISKPE